MTNDCVCVSIPIIRSIYQKFREVDILDKKKTVTALKPGEDRAILLGLGMILSSVVMYFVLGITILRSYADRYSSLTGDDSFHLCCLCQKHVLFIRPACLHTVVLLTQPEHLEKRSQKRTLTWSQFYLLIYLFILPLSE